MMYCYRVWFHNGSTVLVDAWTEKEAREFAKKEFPGQRITEIECLDDRGNVGVEE